MINSLQTFTDHFSGPTRAIALMCVSVCVSEQYDNFGTK